MSERKKELHQMSFAEKIAKACECTPQHVRMVLNGKRSQETKLGQDIMIVAERIKESDNALLRAVRKAVPFGDSKMFVE